MHRRQSWDDRYRLILAAVAACGLLPIFAVMSGNAVPMQLSNAVRECATSADRVAELISGEVKAGERFERRFNSFLFRLTPATFAGVEIPVGWDIGIFDTDRSEDLSRFTLPLRGPNARNIYAWHFRNEDNTGPNTGTVNAPQRHRAFMFSPEVGRSIRDEEEAGKRWANYARIEAFGQGAFDILDFALTEPKPGAVPSFLWLKFTACLTWPSRGH